MEDPFSVSPSGLAKPDKHVCAVCKKEPAPGGDVEALPEVRTVPYCSKQCQVADWKQHKLICVTYTKDNVLNSTGMNFGEKSPKSAKRTQGLRTRGEVLNDLSVWANAHNGDTLTVAAWQAMDLVRDIRKAETHFFALTLRRNAVRTGPRAMYQLVDAEVLPLSLLSEKFASAASLADGVPFSPTDVLNRDREARLRDGALGSVLVMSFELSPGENMSVRDAVLKKHTPIFQPLGLFQVHKRSVSRMPQGPPGMWKICLKSALDGGAYSMRFQAA